MSEPTAPGTLILELPADVAVLNEGDISLDNGFTITNLSGSEVFAQAGSSFLAVQNGGVFSVELVDGYDAVVVSIRVVGGVISFVGPIPILVQARRILQVECRVANSDAGDSIPRYALTPANVVTGAEYSLSLL